MARAASAVACRATFAQQRMDGRPERLDLDG
jgi:hypothetical protein